MWWTWLHTRLSLHRQWVASPLTMSSWRHMAYHSATWKLVPSTFRRNCFRLYSQTVSVESKTEDNQTCLALHHVLQMCTLISTHRMSSYFKIIRNCWFRFTFLCICASFLIRLIYSVGYILGISCVLSHGVRKPEWVGRTASLVITR